MCWKITLEEEFKKNPELKAEDIQEIHTWMKTQPHLPSITDLDVVLFLHANVWDLEQTKRCIEAYYTFKTSYTEFFTDRDPLSTEIQEIAKTINVAILLHGDRDGNCVLWCSLRNPEKRDFNFASFVKYINMITEVFQKENGTVPGYIMVYDVKYFSFSHLFKIPLSQISKCSKYTQEAVSYRTKAIHYVNMNTVLDKLLAIAKPFLQHKVINMLNMHSNIETLFKVIPKEVMPKDYGGDQPTMDEMNDDNLRKLEDYRQFFLDEQKVRVDESKRVSKKGK